jgi:hypothetical protein
MGSTGRYTDKSTKDVVVDELTFETEDGHGGRVLDIARVGSCYYVAWERRSPERTFVMGVVVIVSRKADYVVTKVVTEDMGPCDSNAPARILDLLSPLEAFDGGEYAARWRQRCRDRSAVRSRPAPNSGAVVRFREPIKFTDGATLDTFRFHKNGRKIRFVHPDNAYAQYRITRWQDREFDVLTTS